MYQMILQVSICWAVLTASALTRAEAVELINHLNWSHCNLDFCYKVEAKTAARSLLSHHYTLENVKLTVLEKETYRILRTLNAESAMTSQDWNDWFFKIADQKSKSFDAVTGKIY
jgi:hypothetical protein